MISSTYIVGVRGSYLTLGSTLLTSRVRSRILLVYSPIFTKQFNY